MRSFPGGTSGKEPVANAGDLGPIPGSGRCPGGGHGNPSSILAWRIPWREEPGRLLHREESIGSQRVGHDCSNLAAAELWTEARASLKCPHSQMTPRPDSRTGAEGVCPREMVTLATLDVTATLSFQVCFSPSHTLMLLEPQCLLTTI